MDQLRHKMRLACFGNGARNTDPEEPTYFMCMLLGQYMAQQGITIITGGYGGIMEAVPRGAYNMLKHGVVSERIGYTMKSKPEGNKWLSETVVCNDYFDRLRHLLDVDGFVVVAGGGAGTMVEFFAAVKWNKKSLWPRSRHIAILNIKPSETKGWDKGMLLSLHEWGMIPDPLADNFPIKICSTPFEAVQWVLASAHIKGESR